jgi:hypothetical protein
LRLEYLAANRRRSHALPRTPLSRLTPPRSGLERSDFVLWPTGESSHPVASVPAFWGTADENFRADRTAGNVENGGVEMWRGYCRSDISVPAPFVWRCLSGSTVTPFPHPAHRTGQAALPHPAPGQDFTPSPTARRAQVRSGVRARSARKGARVDRSRPCVV